MTDHPTPSEDLIKEIKALRAEIHTFNQHRFVRIHNTPLRLFLSRFTLGLATGLGTVFGATVVASLVIYWLQGIDWLPLIGDWAGQIAAEMQGESARAEP